MSGIVFQGKLAVKGIFESLIVYVPLQLCKYMENLQRGVFGNVLHCR